MRWASCNIYSTQDHAATATAAVRHADLAREGREAFTEYWDYTHRKVIPLIPPIPMPAWLFATLYAGAELLFGVTGTLSGIAHFAHLGGMIGSALVVLQWRRRAREAR